MSCVSNSPATVTPSTSTTSACASPPGILAPSHQCVPLPPPSRMSCRSTPTSPPPPVRTFVLYLLHIFRHRGGPFVRHLKKQELPELVRLAAAAVVRGA